MNATTRLLVLATASILTASPLFAAQPGIGQPFMLQEASEKPLGSLLNSAGLGDPLKSAGIDIFGYVEAAYTYNFADPDATDESETVSLENSARSFDVENQDLSLSQIMLSVERDVSPVEGDVQFNVGGRLDFLYGSDARFIHANGLQFYSGQQPSSVPDAGLNVQGPDEQFDLYQAYVDVLFPVGNGLRLRLGKFAYFKTIDPNASLFYSRSLSFASNVLPYTQTGGYVTYFVNDSLSFDLGMSRGYDQSLEDKNDSLDGFGRVRWAIDEKTVLIFRAVSGPDTINDNSHYSTAMSIAVSHALADNLTVFGEGLFVYQAVAPSATDADPDGILIHGLAGYAQLELDSHVSLAGRIEYFRDEDGVVLAAQSATYVSTTLGVTVTPLPDNKWTQGFQIRPEIRWDWASKDVFDSGTDENQFTAAIDAIYNF